jgi:hypothetical protein
LFSSGLKRLLIGVHPFTQQQSNKSQTPEEVIQENKAGEDAAEEATNQRCQKLFSIMNELSEQKGDIDLLELLVIFRFGIFDWFN